MQMLYRGIQYAGPVALVAAHMANIAINVPQVIAVIALCWSAKVAADRRRDRATLARNMRNYIRAGGLGRSRRTILPFGE